MLRSRWTRAATSSGTRKIRTSVSRLGRFVKASQLLEYFGRGISPGGFHHFFIRNCFLSLGAAPGGPVIGFEPPTVLLEAGEAVGSGGSVCGLRIVVNRPSLSPLSHT